MRKDSKGIITNGWADTTVFCVNHSKPLPMELGLERGTPYYLCPECQNRINISEFEKMLAHVHKEIIEAEMSDSSLNLTNYHWKERSGIGRGNEYTVLKHEGAVMQIGVLNNAAIKR